MSLTRNGLIAWFCLVALGCGDDSPSDAGLDAARDLRDARDVPVDAGQDVADGAVGEDVRDAVEPDAGLTEWLAMPDLPLFCDVDYATNPESLLAIAWVSCGQGCTYLDPREWPTGVRVLVGESGRGRYNILQPLGVRFNGFYSGHIDEGLVGAWRYRNQRADAGCLVGTSHGDEERVGFALSVIDEPGLFREERIYHPHVDELTSALPPIQVLTPADGFPFTSSAQPILASATTLIARVPSRHVYLFQDGDYDVLGGSPPIDSSPQRPRLVGDHAFWSNWGSKITIAHARAGGNAQVFLEYPEDEIQDFDTDGENFVWVRCPDRRCREATLWTAPYTDDPADLEPRLVMEGFPTGGSMYLTGPFATRDDLSSFEAYRLADGQRFEYRPNFEGVGRFRADYPVYAGPEEMAFVTFVHGRETLLRVRYEAFTPVEPEE